MKYQHFPILSADEKNSDAEQLNSKIFPLYFYQQPVEVWAMCDVNTKLHEHHARSDIP